MQVTIRDAGDLRAVNRALGKAANGKQLKAELRSELREVGRPLVPKVKAAWRSAPSRSAPSRSRRVGGRADLRAMLARATRLEVRSTGKQAGVRVRTDGRKMPDGMRSLPGYAEGVRRRPWRHPVHGDTGTWVTQDPFPRFYRAVQPDEAAARRACERAVGRVLDKIARAR